MDKSKSGFTIVELLITIVVIGILAAISIVAYNGIQNRANDTAVQSDIRNALTKVHIKAIDDGVFPKESTELEGHGIKATQKAYSTQYDFNFIYCPPYPYNTSKNPAMIATSKSGKTFIYNQKGITQYTGSWTMNDYVDICIAATDENNVFVAGNYAGDPNLWITTPGYSKNNPPTWRVWAGG